MSLASRVPWVSGGWPRDACIFHWVLFNLQYWGQFIYVMLTICLFVATITPENKAGRHAANAALDRTRKNIRKRQQHCVFLSTKYPTIILISNHRSWKRVTILLFLCTYSLSVLYTYSLSIWNTEKTCHCKLDPWFCDKKGVSNLNVAERTRKPRYISSPWCNSCILFCNTKRRPAMCVIYLYVYLPLLAYQCVFFCEWILPISLMVTLLEWGKYTHLSIQLSEC